MNSEQQTLHDLNSSKQEFDNGTEYVETLMYIITTCLPIISKYNIHLYQNILSAIELVMDQSIVHNVISQSSKKVFVSEETKKDVDEIVKKYLQETKKE